jgi:hypothetical protein
MAGQEKIPMFFPFRVRVRRRKQSDHGHTQPQTQSDEISPTSRFEPLPQFFPRPLKFWQTPMVRFRSGDLNFLISSATEATLAENPAARGPGLEIPARVSFSGKDYAITRVGQGTLHLNGRCVEGEDPARVVTVAFAADSAVTAFRIARSRSFRFRRSSRSCIPSPSVSRVNCGP